MFTEHKYKRDNEKSTQRVQTFAKAAYYPHMALFLVCLLYTSDAADE